MAKRTWISNWRAQMHNRFLASKKAQPQSPERIKMYDTASRWQTPTIQRRYNMLKGYGLLAEERRILAATLKRDEKSLRGAIMQCMLTHRRDWYRQTRYEMLRAGVTDNTAIWREHESRVRAWYKSARLPFSGERLTTFGKPDPLKMLRWYREEYDPDRTPQPKKRSKQPRNEETLHEARQNTRRFWD